MDETIKIPSDIKHIGFFADVHGHYERMLTMFNDNPDICHWFCCGDLIDMKQPLHNNQPTLRVAKKYNVISVIGNHELSFRKNGLSGYDQDNQDYLQDMPLCVDIEFNEKKISVFHASPASVDEYIPSNMDEERLQEIFADVKSDIIVLGHLHESFHKKINSFRVVNPGSLGVPIDKPSYCIISHDGNVEIKEFI